MFRVRDLAKLLWHLRATCDLETDQAQDLARKEVGVNDLWAPRNTDYRNDQSRIATREARIGRIHTPGERNRARHPPSGTSVSSRGRRVRATTKR